MKPRHLGYIASTSKRTLCVVVDVSAKIAALHEITPQTQYVGVHYNGDCRWHPRLELSETHCDIDVTWFPFDEQTCSLVFTSWTLLEGEISFDYDDEDTLENYLPTDEWDLTCAYSLTKMLYHTWNTFWSTLFIENSIALVKQIHSLKRFVKTTEVASQH